MFDPTICQICQGLGSIAGADCLACQGIGNIPPAPPVRPAGPPTRIITMTVDLRNAHVCGACNGTTNNGECTECVGGIVGPPRRVPRAWSSREVLSVCLALALIFLLLLVPLHSVWSAQPAFAKTPPNGGVTPNYVRSTDATPTPITNIKNAVINTFYDPLINLSLSSDHSPDLWIDGGYPERVGGDGARVAHTANGSYVTYHQQHMVDLTTVAYTWSGDPHQAFTFFSSVDGKTWRPEYSHVMVTPPTGANWEQEVYTITFLQTTNYVKIVWPAIGAVNWSPQLGTMAILYANQ